VILSQVRREKPTLRQLLANLAGAPRPFHRRRHAEQIADLIEDGSPTAPRTASTSCPRLLPAMLDVFARK